MRKEFLIPPLDFDQSKKYFQEYLKDGNTIAHEILNFNPFHQGTFFALTSISADITKLHNFNNGNILPLHSLEEFEFNKVKYKSRKKSSSKNELSNYIENILKKPKKLYCLFEELIRFKSDKNIETIKLNISYYKTEVYYYLKSDECCEEKIRDCPIFS